MQQDAQPLVEIKGLDHHFGHGEDRKQVLFGINLTIYPGQTIIMTGPSGSGKTTLLTLIGALRTVQAGSLKFMDREMRGLSTGQQVAIRRQIGFIFQSHNLFEALTAYQNVCLATELIGYPKKTARQMSVDLLNRLGLGNRMDYKPQKLSGGQKQRVAIGRALINSPKLVLADEPTASLDRESGRQVFEIFQELVKEKGCALIIVTQDNRILDKAEDVIQLVDGELV